MRTLKRSHPALRDDIADLITRRPVPGPGLDRLGPFLFLNHHGPQTYPAPNQGLPFGPHPHRGFETVTIILEGSLAHYDSGGHESVIDAGGVQWMTAGSGLIHAELSPETFKQQGGELEILQLWVNLPAALKMTAPRYSGVQKEKIPKVPLEKDAGELELIAGEYHGAQGPILPLTGVFMSVVRLHGGASVTLPVPNGRDVFLYVIHGALNIAGQSIPQWHLAELNDEPEPLQVMAEGETVLLFGHADPINEPVVAHGPFVMNTLEEIHQAYDDYRNGAFNGNGKLGSLER